MGTTVFGQTVSGLHIPSEKPLKPKELARAWNEPEVFCLVLSFDARDSNYRERDLDLLDSAYSIGFDRNNPRLYTLTIEGYADRSDSTLMAARVESVYRYFTMRGEELSDEGNVGFPIRFAYNPVHCSCHGDTTELLRFEVPTDRMIYRCSDLTESRKRLNKEIALEDCVLITFRDNPDECIGSSRGCFLPANDSTVRGAFTQLFLPKGSVYSVRNTKDECPQPVSITIEEHMDYKPFLDNYILVPHRRQIILPVGYVVLHSSFNRKTDECKEDMPDSVFVRFMVTEEQVESKLRIFAKVSTAKGVEYKSLATKKLKNGPMLMLQAGLNPTQFDTIFLAKRIQLDEIGKYLYEADMPTEQGAVTITVKDREYYYKPFRLGRTGEYEFKKAFRNMLRIADTDEEIEGNSKDEFRNDGDEEL